jgi:hypothetical protein
MASQETRGEGKDLPINVMRGRGGLRKTGRDGFVGIVVGDHHAAFLKR